MENPINEVSNANLSQFNVQSHEQVLDEIVSHRPWWHHPLGGIGNGGRLNGSDPNRNNPRAAYFFE
ncbi:unannotated protein [freshwater metagenome]|uniref:Unannotated protein n=1 Tax=freshwater metagenome TaxID=449393 RepID=A0A6J7SQ03_9ZZZZ